VKEDVAAIMAGIQESMGLETASDIKAAMAGGGLKGVQKSYVDEIKKARSPNTTPKGSSKNSPNNSPKPRGRRLGGNPNSPGDAEAGATQGTPKGVLKGKGLLLRRGSKRGSVSSPREGRASMRTSMTFGKATVLGEGGKGGAEEEAGSATGEADAMGVEFDTPIHAQRNTSAVLQQLYYGSNDNTQPHTNDTDGMYTGHETVGGGGEAHKQ
jgi:hypothetical protein